MRAKNFSRVKEAVVAWSEVQQLLRTGDRGTLVPVVIPRDRRGYAPFFWLGLSLYCLAASVAGVLMDGGLLIAPLAFMGFFLFGFIGAVGLWRNLIVEIE
ncbi:MAG: SPFH domain-containing protein, partial [Chloroflexota bacterium]